jgi:hypothetical protein
MDYERLGRGYCTPQCTPPDFGYQMYGDVDLGLLLKRTGRKKVKHTAVLLQCLPFRGHRDNKTTEQFICSARLCIA